jgi:acyl dehydratase
MNPLHHDEKFCRDLGLPMPLAPGMLVAGILAGWLVGFVEPASIRRYRVRFESSVWPGDWLTCAAAVAAGPGRMTPGDEPIDLELTCHRRTDELAVRAWVTVAR